MKLTKSTKINAVINYTTNSDALIQSSDLNMTFSEYISMTQSKYPEAVDRLLDMMNVEYTKTKQYKTPQHTFNLYTYQTPKAVFSFIELVEKKKR
jgi:hypothetical protein